MQVMFTVVNKSVMVCKDTTNTSYSWGSYHPTANHTTYIEGLPTLYISYASP